MRDYKELKIDDLNITLQHMEDALDVLLTAYIQQGRNPVGAVNIYGPGTMTLSNVPMGKLADLLALCENPIRHALREAIVRMGRHLHERLGSCAAMLEVAERASAKDPQNEEWRIDVIDKAWDGIGGWLA